MNHTAESGCPAVRDDDGKTQAMQAGRGLRRMLWVCAALAVMAVGLAREQGRGLAFYTPANLRAESELHAHFFNYAKWFNRYYSRFQKFPAAVAGVTAEVDPKADVDRVRVDPWGTEYRVTLTPSWYSVLSAGPDRLFFTPDDRLLRSQRPGVMPPAELTAAP